LGIIVGFFVVLVTSPWHASVYRSAVCQVRVEFSDLEHTVVGKVHQHVFVQKDTTKLVVVIGGDSRNFGHLRNTTNEKMHFATHRVGQLLQIEPDRVAHQHIFRFENFDVDETVLQVKVCRWASN